jgi:hypothetical protein
MVEVVQPLDIETVLVNVLAGSIPIFVFLTFIFASFLAARFRMPSVVFGMILVLLSIVLQQYMGGLFVLAVIIVAFTTYFTLAKVFDR